MICIDGNTREIVEVRKDTRYGHEGEYIVVYDLTVTKKSSMSLNATDELEAYKTFVSLHKADDEGEPNNVS